MELCVEAMATGLPVIATKWGGPANYLNESTGILIEPAGRESFIDEIGDAMIRLARSPELRAELGKAARTRAVAEFDWERKIDVMLEVYARAAQIPLSTRPGSTVTRVGSSAKGWVASDSRSRIRPEARPQAHKASLVNGDRVARQS